MKIFPQLKMLSTAEDQSLCLHKLCETRRNSPKGDGEINEHAHTHRHTHTYTHTDRQTDTQTHRHTDTSSFAASSAALKLPQQAAPCPTLACSFDLLSHSGKSLFGHSCGPSAITRIFIALILASLSGFSHFGLDHSGIYTGCVCDFLPWGQFHTGGLATISI
jgi:hypothetical protein